MASKPEAAPHQKFSGPQQGDTRLAKPVDPVLQLDFKRSALRIDRNPRGLPRFHTFRALFRRVFTRFEPLF